MARLEAAKEDLVRDATAMARRVSLRLPEFPHAVFIGLRSNDAASVFFGEDPVYHFSDQGHLRRGFVEGKLIKAERGELIALQRQRTPETTHLVSTPLTLEQTQQLLSRLRADLVRLAEAIATHVDQPEIVEAAVPDNPAWLRTLPDTLRTLAQATPASRPHVQ